jgi:hypothetical protein
MATNRNSSGLFAALVKISGRLRTEQRRVLRGVETSGHSRLDGQECKVWTRWDEGTDTLTDILTDLIPWSMVLLEKLTGS